MRGKLESGLLRHPNAFPAERSWVLAVAGDWPAAYAALAEFEPTGPEEAFEAAELRWWFGFLRGSNVGLNEVRRAAGTISAPLASSSALARLAVDEARVALADGANWLSPLLAASPALQQLGIERDWRWQFLRMRFLYAARNLAPIVAWLVVLPYIISFALGLLVSF